MSLISSNWATVFNSGSIKQSTKLSQIKGSEQNKKGWHEHMKGIAMLCLCVPALFVSLLLLDVTLPRYIQWG